MPLFWILVFCLVALVWVLSIVDIVRRHYPSGEDGGVDPAGRDPAVRRLDHLLVRA